MEALNFIVNWINSYVKAHKLNALVVGVSGGIDSALTSTLCGMTGVKTVAVSMPIDQKNNELIRAEKHIDWLSNNFPNLYNETINLTALFELYKKSIPVKFHSNLGLANTRARLRMTTLYQIAAQENGIVVGTGNKIEDFGIGFFTKYGDGGVDISPIADLTKSEVNKLAQKVGIISDIIEAEPTDGLWEDGRTDETQIGATYKELEWAMEYNGEKKLTSREKTVLNIYTRLKNQNEHKTTPIPICKIPKNLKI